MAQAISHWPVTSKACVQSWACPCGVCVDKLALGQGFFFKRFSFPLSLSFRLCFTVIFRSFTTGTVQSKQLTSFNKKPPFPMYMVSHPRRQQL